MPHQFINSEENANSNKNTKNNYNNNNNSKYEDLTFFKKCGEITISSDNPNIFGLSCVFCNGICFQLDIFKVHIQEEHGQDIKDIYANECDIKSLCYVQQQTSISIDHENDKAANKMNTNEVNTTVTTNTTSTNTSNSTSTNTNTNTMTTLATLLSQVDFELEMENIMENKNELEMENIQELVYIMDDSNSVLNMQEEEEETIQQPFHISSDDDAAIKTSIPTTTTTITKEIKGCAMENIKIENSPGYHHHNTLEITTQSIFEEQSIGQRAVPELKIPARFIGQDRGVITYLLDAYKNNPKFWNPNHPEYKYNAPRNVFDELAMPLKRDMKVTLKGEEIFAILNGLRSRYRRELTKMKKTKDKHKSNLWYFENMDFLREVIESKRAEREIKNRHKITSNANDGTMISNKPTKIVQSKENLIFLLECFKSKEELWNPEHEDFSACDKLSIYKDISKELLEEKNIEMPANVCKKEIDKLTARYRKELNAIHSRKGLHIPKLWCFEQMDFLSKIFEVEFQKRKRRKKGILTVSSRINLNRAKNIVFENFEDQLKFIEMYKAHPALWSCEHPDYRSVKYRGEAIRSIMGQFCESFNKKIQCEELEKTIFTLRKEFSAEKLKRILCSVEEESEEMGSNGSKQHHSKCNANGQTHTDCNNSAMPPQIYNILATFLTENIGPFRCDTCQMIIKTTDQYKMHKSAHDGTLPFICVICNKGFQVPGNLAIHIRRHKRDFPYSCEQCKKSFATSTEVTIHKRVHTGHRPYICDLCGKTFKTWSFFDIHRRVHFNQSNFLCPICEKGFYEKNRFTAHMNHHLNIRKHRCKNCGKSFTTYSNLKKHLELHLPERKYKCDICRMPFAQNASLRWHKRKKHLSNSAYDEDDLLEQ